MDEQWKREIILEHYQHPKNRGLVKEKQYLEANTNNESCIDEINLQIKVSEDKIEDMRFDGEACAICTSSASIMIDTLIGKNIQEVKKILTNFLNMIDEKEYDPTILEQAIVYSDVCKQSNRKKCALLPWWATEKILQQLDNIETNH